MNALEYFVNSSAKVTSFTDFHVFLQVFRMHSEIRRKMIIHIFHASYKAPKETFLWLYLFNINLFVIPQGVRGDEQLVFYLGLFIMLLFCRNAEKGEGYVCLLCLPLNVFVPVLYICNVGVWPSVHLKDEPVVLMSKWVFSDLSIHSLLIWFDVSVNSRALCGDA